MKELETFTTVAQTQPHTAYAAFTHGVIAKWNYVLRVTNLEQSTLNLLKPLEHAITTRFFPRLTGQSPPNDLLRELFALPPRLGGLGLVNPTISANQHYLASQHITAVLVHNIQQQSVTEHQDFNNLQQRVKADEKKKRTATLKEKADKLLPKLSPSLQRCVQLSQEKGASSWLSALPLEQHGYNLHKSEFKDAIALRYDLPLQRLPSHCKCGNFFNVEHALSCSTGGYPSIRHNEVRDITASLLQQVCHNVTIEPHLQTLSGEVMNLRSANRDDEARLDISECGVWGGRFERTFFDVRVFNPSARSNRLAPIPAVYRKHGKEKKRSYEQRVRDVEHTSFTPLVMSATGGMAPIAATFYSRLASMISEKKGMPYHQIIGWIRCKLSFALLRMSIMCIRGSMNTSKIISIDNTAVQIAESHIKF